jgi:hypothetical protein
VYGDMTIMNTVFLVIQEREENFDRAISDLQSTYGNRTRLKYVRSKVPYNFVEIVIHW